MCFKESRIVNVDQITVKVDGIVMESVSPIHYVIDHAKLLDILNIVSIKTTIDSIKLIMSFIIGHRTHVVIVVFIIITIFYVCIQLMFSSIMIYSMNCIEPLLTEKFVVACTESVVEHILLILPLNLFSI